MTSPTPKLTVRGLKARPVNVPMPRPLCTSGGAVETTPLVLIDLETEEGVTGHSYVFCYAPLALEPMTLLIRNLEPLIKGDSASPRAIDERLPRRFRLLGPQGLIGMALAGIDMAAWDAAAKACGQPLVRLLGGEPRPVPAYNSCGLGIVGAARAMDEARELIAPGFAAVKVRLGYPTAREDIEVVRAVRRAVGDDVQIMSDYNQSLDVPEAIRRARALDDEGIAWIEEPTRADDFAGHAAIARETRTPIQLGENWWGPNDMAKSIAAFASDLAMPDAVKIGGASGWLKAAALAEAASLPVSSHLFPEISAHLLSVTSTRHWLEYVDWAAPILETPLKIENGAAIASLAPGTGIAWREDAVRRYSYD